MILPQILFYIFSALLIISALGVILSRNPVRCALWLVLCFIWSAGLWLLLHAEFLALILVVVYVGAVMTLFLFVVMMLNIHQSERQEGFVRFVALGILAVAVILTAIITVLHTQNFSSGLYLTRVTANASSNTAALGKALYLDNMYPFEIAGVILLVAIIATITLTLRERTQQTKNPDISSQVRVQSKNRVTLVAMPTELPPK